MTLRELDSSDRISHSRKFQQIARLNLLPFSRGLSVERAVRWKTAAYERGNIGMTKINANAARRRKSEVDVGRMNSIVAAASTAHDLDAGHKVVLEAERKRVIARKLASRTRGK